MLCKYVIYLTYYCGLAKNLASRKTFTAKWFLAACGYSTQLLMLLLMGYWHNSLLVKKIVVYLLKR